jgi:hypothetical protein
MRRACPAFVSVRIPLIYGSGSVIIARAKGGRRVSYCAGLRVSAFGSFGLLSFRVVLVPAFFYRLRHRSYRYQQGLVVQQQQPGVPSSTLGTHLTDTDHPHTSSFHLPSPLGYHLDDRQHRESSISNQQSAYPDLHVVDIVDIAPVEREIPRHSIVVKPSPPRSLVLFIITLRKRPSL